MAPEQLIAAPTNAVTPSRHFPARAFSPSYKSVDTVTDSLRKMPRKVAGGSTSNATKGPAEGEDQQISYLDNFLQGARSVPPQRTRFPSHGST